MSARWEVLSGDEAGTLPEGEGLRLNLARRYRVASLWRTFFVAAVLVAIVSLTALLYNVIDQAFGLVAVQNTVEPASLAVGGVPLAEQTSEQLLTLLQQRVPSAVLRRMESEQPLAQRSREDLNALVLERVVQLRVLKSWPLHLSLLDREAIEAQVGEQYPQARLVFRSWLTPEFLTRSQSSTPALAGVRTALLGSLWTIAITLLVAFPLGVGAAIYLEEYARDSWINRALQTNISNLAGVPSIIYGILGLAMLVRGLEPLTSGAWFGAVDPTTANGRTILSAGLTLALLVLPVVIINAQEAIRAVPRSLRLASYALGATQWQTIWHHVLPSALPGILTGSVMAMSRAIGETAPLVVVGASTFIAVDPSGPFSKFTTLPIQIYQWTSRPQDQFRNIAAAAILVLLALFLTLNASAVLLRNRYSRRYVS
jgi:phosphate transport system permease protein